MSYIGKICVRCEIFIKEEGIELIASKSQETVFVVDEICPNCSPEQVVDEIFKKN